MDSILSLLVISLCGFLIHGSQSPKTSLVAGHRVVTIHVLYDRLQTGQQDYVDYGVPKALFQDLRGLYWVSTHWGLYNYDETKDRWDRFVAGPALQAESLVKLCQTADGMVWGFSLVDQSIACLDSDGRNEGDSGCFPPFSGKVRSAFPGNSGKLWAVWSNGISCYDGHGWNRSSALSESDERHIAKMPDPQVGVTFPPKVAERLRVMRGTALNEVEAGLQDRAGYVWLASHRAILRFDPRLVAWKIYPVPNRLSHIVRIYEDRTSRLWFGDEKGSISVHNPVSSTWAFYGLSAYGHLRLDDPEAPVSPLFIRSIYQDREGVMMFATELGLFAFAERSNKWDLWTPENSGLPDSRVETFNEDRLGRIWVGTGRGIVVLDP